MNKPKKWFAVYTKPRCEKKVHQLLSLRGIESYCPLNKVSRQWSDRIKIVEEPLFKSYVFVCINREDLTSVRMIEGVLNFVYWMGRPAIVRQCEIDSIRRFLNEYENVEARAIDIRPHSKVLIQQGILMDKEATVRKLMHNRVEVVIESVGFRLIASIEKSNILAI
jgi:transcription antitermination factor NusG